MLTRLLTMDDVQGLLTMKICIKLQEDIFASIAEGLAYHADNEWLPIPEVGGWLKLLSGAAPASSRAAAKVTLRMPELPPGQNLAGIILLFDTALGTVRAIVDAVYISAMRTSASAAFASRYLARSDSRTVGIVGTGAQARFTLDALCEVFPSIDTVYIYSRQETNRERFCADMGAKHPITINATSTAKEAVSPADIVVTATNAIDPVIEASWMRPGMHGLFVGNKKEVPYDVFSGCTVVVDSLDLAVKDGKIAAAIDQGALSPADVHGELAEVVAGRVPGRTGAEEITIYDCSGLAEQDLICADYVCTAAERAGIGLTMDLRANLLS